MEDLLLGRIAALVPEFAVKDLPLGRTLMMMMIFILGENGDWDFRISDLVKTPMEQIFNLCGEFRWSLEGQVSQIHCPHLHVGAPGNFSDLLKSVQLLKREWDVNSNGKLLNLFIPTITATLAPEFAVEDLALGRTAAWVPEFAGSLMMLSLTNIN